MPRTFTNSDYRFNTADFSQYHTQTLKMKNYENEDYEDEKLSKAFTFVMVLQFPIYTKLVTHVEGADLQNVYASITCRIHSATHWTQGGRQTSSDLHDMYCVFSTHHTLQHDMEVTVEHALRRRHGLTCVEQWPVHHCLQLEFFFCFIVEEHVQRCDKVISC